MQLDEAFLILEKPAVAYTRYLDFCQARAWIDHVQRLHKSLAIHNPSMYRGISRLTISAFPHADVAALREHGFYDVDEHRAAKLRLLTFQDALKDNDDLDGSMLLNREQAIAVYNLLDPTTYDTYEIIKISRGTTVRTAMTLGYDIGYWGGDFFSLICDCAIMPVWHPPIEESIGVLANEVKRLNTSLLFNHASEAEAFRNYYTSQYWAETESFKGEFCIIQVDTCDIPTP